jgi:hypothetical protein
LLVSPNEYLVAGLQKCCESLVHPKLKLPTPQSLACALLRLTVTVHLISDKPSLTPKGLQAISAFLKFGQAIVDAIFVQKISNFW